MKNILEISGLCKSYKSFSLKNLSFCLQEDCITGFIGVNGAGKTTTIRTILGLAKRDAGVVKIFGQDITKNEQELKNRIGIVFDEGGFYDPLTINEMKSIIAPAYTNWQEKHYKGYLDRFSLNPKQKISTLSKGMRMQFALAMALSHEAELLIMDEPTSGLDPLFRSELLNIMTDYLKAGGRSVFFSTHITSDLDKIADMLILIHDGEIKFEAEKDYLLDNYRLVKGDAKELTTEKEKLFLGINKTDFGFSGITEKAEEVKKYINGVLFERPSIEDIMLAHIGGQR